MLLQESGDTGSVYVYTLFLPVTLIVSLTIPYESVILRVSEEFSTGVTSHETVILLAVVDTNLKSSMTTGSPMTILIVVVVQLPYLLWLNLQLNLYCNCQTRQHCSRLQFYY